MTPVKCQKCQDDICHFVQLFQIFLRNFVFIYHTFRHFSKLRPNKRNKGSNNCDDGPNKWDNGPNNWDGVKMTDRLTLIGILCCSCSILSPEVIPFFSYSSNSALYFSFETFTFSLRLSYHTVRIFMEISMKIRVVFILFSKFNHFLQFFCKISKTEISR